MRKTINFGEKGVELCSNAATPYLFKQTFKKDVISQVMQAEKSDELDPEMLDTINKLAYVMRKQAIGESKTISHEDFYSWLEEFENSDMLRASRDILELYFGNLHTTSNQKKKSGH